MPEEILKPGWKWVKFGDVVHLNNERIADPKTAGIERYVGLEHITPEDLRIRDWGLVADGTTFTNCFKPDQVLFGKRRAYQRKVAVADFAGVCSSDIYVFEPKDTSVLLPELLPYICQSEGFYEYAIKTSAGSLSPRTNWNHLRKYEFALPPMEKQQIIVNILDTLSEIQQHSYQSLLEKIQCLEESLFIHFFGEPIENLKGWHIQPLGSLAKLKRGPFGGALRKDIFVDEGYKVYEQQHAIHKDFSIGNYYIDAKKYSLMSTFSVKPGDFIVSCSGTIGQIAQIPPNAEPGIINQALLKISIDETILTDVFFISLFESQAFQRELFGVSRGTGIRNFPSMKIIRSIPIIVPPYDLQAKYTNIHKSLRKQFESQTIRLEQIKNIRKQLEPIFIKAY